LIKFSTFALDFPFFHKASVEQACSSQSSVST
jgi:hypothetical protein